MPPVRTAPSTGHSAEFSVPTGVDRLGDGATSSGRTTDSTGNELGPSWETARMPRVGLFEDGTSVTEFFTNEKRTANDGTLRCRACRYARTYPQHLWKIRRASAPMSAFSQNRGMRHIDKYFRVLSVAGARRVVVGEARSRPFLLRLVTHNQPLIHIGGSSANKEGGVRFGGTSLLARRPIVLFAPDLSSDG